MNIFKSIYNSLRKFYGWHIKVIDTGKYNLGLKLPRYLPSFTHKLPEKLCQFTDYIYLDGYDYESETFKTDYENLIRGLDEESIENVNKVIDIYKEYARLRKMKKVTIDDLSELDKLLTIPEDIANSMQNEFFNTVEKINENLYKCCGYYLEENIFASNVFYYKHGMEDLQTLDKVKNRNIVDVGGYIGDSALVLSKYTDKNVYTFEACKENYVRMDKTFELNNVKNVIPVNYALGDSIDGKVSLGGIGPSSHVVSIDGDDCDINYTTLDKYVSENNIDVGLIKVDIEGFEQKFLKGAQETIKTQKPVLLISIYHNPDDYLHIKPIIDSWNLGYKFRVICPVEAPIFETLLVAEVVE